MAGEPAVGAAFDVPAQHRCPARLDCCHDAALSAAELDRVGLPERCAVAAEDIRHLEHGPHCGRSVGRCHRQAQPIQRAGRIGDQVGGDLSVASRRRESGMAEQHLDDANVGAALEQMGGETMP